MVKKCEIEIELLDLKETAAFLVETLKRRKVAAMVLIRRRAHESEITKPALRRLCVISF